MCVCVCGCARTHVCVCVLARMCVYVCACAHVCDKGGGKVNVSSEHRLGFYSCSACALVVVSPHSQCNPGSTSLVQAV